MRIEIEHQKETYGSGRWMVDIMSDDAEVGSLACAEFGNKAHAGAYRKGVEAFWRGNNQNPYGWDRGTGLGMLRRSGFRNAWRFGWETAQAIDIAASRSKRTKN